jgi:hypothetical protein
MIDFPKIGDKVRLRKDIYEPADEYAPAGYIAKKVDVLIVRKVNQEREHWSVQVSHESVTNNSFGVDLQEIEVSL